MLIPTHLESMPTCRNALVSITHQNLYCVKSYMHIRFVYVYLCTNVCTVRYATQNKAVKKKHYIQQSIKHTDRQCHLHNTTKYVMMSLKQI